MTRDADGGNPLRELISEDTLMRLEIDLVTGETARRWRDVFRDLPEETLTVTLYHEPTEPDA